PAGARGRRRAGRPCRARDARIRRGARPRGEDRDRVGRGRRRRQRVDLRDRRGRQRGGAPPATREARRDPDRARGLPAHDRAPREGATVLPGRGRPYGESITYWPLAEMVKTSAGISDDDPLDEAVEKLRVCCEDEAIADLLGLASGVLHAVRAERRQEEIAWA